MHFQLRELVSTIPALVRNIYHEKLGWFGGETHELASTLTPAVRAAALADALGGAENSIKAPGLQRRHATGSPDEGARPGRGRPGVTPG